MALRIRLTITTLLLVLTMSAQQAHWITADDSARNHPNTWIEFHKDFALKKKPRKAEAKIAADSKYWLWINGELAVFEGALKRGPNRTDTYYDTVDLAPYLRKGNNDIRLLLWYFGKPGFSHVSSGQAAVIFDAPSIGLTSDRSWKSQRLKAYQTATHPSPNFRLSESNIRYDARLEKQTEYKPSLETGTWNGGVWGKLVERPIPQWHDYGIKPVTFRQSEDGKGNIVLSAKLPYNMQMTPVIRLDDSQGGTCIRIETDHAHGGSQHCIRAEYITRKGEQQYESLGWMNGDVLYLIYPKEADINVHSIAYRETGYDCRQEGRFSCSDSTVNRFWEKAMRTLYVNMRDTYFDCPDRERAQWWGDVTILMGQSFYQLSPRANDLIRKAIRELVDWQKSDSVLFSPIPAENWDKELPAQSLTAISTYGFWYYYLHTGDEETMRYVYPAMRKYLGIWTLDQDGLTQYRSGGWPWGDWGTDTDMRLILAAWHYLALQSATNIASLTGNEQDIADYSRQMKLIKQAFNRCWNGYAYRHPSYQGATDDRVQALAIVAGLADSTRYTPIFELFKTQEFASPYMEKYVMEALMKIGKGEYALKRFKKRFSPMIADTLHTTLYEGWKEGGYGGGSTNHAWSGGMLTVLCEQMMGIRPTSPGWCTFEVCPYPIIPKCSIEIPTVQGVISYSYSHGEEQFKLKLAVPKGTTAHVSLPSYTSIMINGKQVSKQALHTLPEGSYDITAFP